MNMTQKLMILMLALLALTSCKDSKDEPTPTPPNPVEETTEIVLSAPTANIENQRFWEKNRARCYHGAVRPDYHDRQTHHRQQRPKAWLPSGITRSTGRNQKSWPNACGISFSPWPQCGMRRGFCILPKGNHRANQGLWNRASAHPQPNSQGENAWRR